MFVEDTYLVMLYLHQVYFLTKFQHPTIWKQPLFLGSRPFKQQILLKSIDERIWSSKIKAISKQLDVRISLKSITNVGSAYTSDNKCQKDFLLDILQITVYLNDHFVLSTQCKLFHKLLNNIQKSQLNRLMKIDMQDIKYQVSF